MTGYTGRDRIRAAFRREYADRVPFYPMVGRCQAKYAGFTVRQFFTDAAALSNATLAFYERFGPDLVGVAGDTTMEAEAFGNEVGFFEDAMPYVTKRFLEDKGNLAKLEVPNPRRHGRLPIFLEACERVRSVVKDTSVGGIIGGPWGTASQLRGLEQLLYDTVDDPDFVHQLMKLTTEFAKRFGDAQRELGIGLCIGEPAGSCSVVSPHMFRTFILPYLQDIVAHFQQTGAAMTLHICGYVDPIMEDMVASGAAAISIDSPSSLKRLIEVSQKKVVIIGNVPTLLFLEGTKEQMEAAVRECIDIAAAGSAYILCSGCEVPQDTPIEAIEYFKEAALNYGSYESGQEID